MDLKGNNSPETGNSSCVYLGLGSNIGNSVSIIQNALDVISEMPGVQFIRVSSFYQTSPVSPIAQRDFINAVCVLNTTLAPETFFDAIHRLEVCLGKVPKEKNAPRAIDIDILFFGMHFYRTSDLCIPHLHWRERLFVLAPLLEITEEITIPVNDHGECETIHLTHYLETFSNPHQERVVRQLSSPF